MVHGDLPVPRFWYLLGARPTQVSTRSITVEMTADNWLSSGARLIYGGALSGLGAAALNLVLKLEDTSSQTTRMLTFAHQFTRMVVPDGSPVVAEATVSHRGRTHVVAEAVLRDSKGNAVGFSHGSGLVDEQ
jgi:uncharacterized protein (TIGR00369 family)